MRYCKKLCGRNLRDGGFWRALLDIGITSMYQVRVMRNVEPKLSQAVLAYSVAHGVVNIAWLVERWGWTNAARSSAAGIGLPALAEVWITSLDKLLRHRMEPQILGVPLAIPLLWFNVIFSSLTVTEAALSRLRLDEEDKRVLLAPATALTATSLDLVMDCFGLDRGLWEWNIDGPCATEIEGANGRRGIPLLNFFGWVFLVGAIVLIHQSFTRRVDAEENQEPGRRTSAERLSLVALIPYYLVSVIWAIRKRELRYVLYSAIFPATLIAALRRK